MRQLVKDFVKICKESGLTNGFIAEIGSYQVEGQDSDLRQMFPETYYMGFDMRPGPGVDAVLDITLRELPSKYNTILCLDTLEHISDPFEAVKNMANSLTLDGKLIIVTVMNFPIHSFPNDYFRYTTEGLIVMTTAAGLTCYVTIDSGKGKHPHTVAIIASKEPFFAPIDELMQWAEDNKMYGRKSLKRFMKRMLNKIHLTNRD